MLRNATGKACPVRRAKIDGSFTTMTVEHLFSNIADLSFDIAAKAAQLLSRIRDNYVIGA